MITADRGAKTEQSDRPSSHLCSCCCGWVWGTKWWWWCSRTVPLLEFHLKLAGSDTPSTRLLLVAKFHFRDAAVSPDAWDSFEGLRSLSLCETPPHILCMIDTATWNQQAFILHKSPLIQHYNRMLGLREMGFKVSRGWTLTGKALTELQSDPVSLFNFP